MQTAFGLNIPMTLEDVCSPQKMALLVYDMQVGIAQQLPDSAALIQQVKTVIEAARSHQMRIFFSRHTTLPTEVAGVSQLKGAMALQRVANVAQVKPNFLPNSPAHAIIPELKPLPSEVAFDKLTMSAFVGSYLDLALRDARIEAVAIAGAVLEFGIEPTVRHAADLGYIPVLIQDACYSFSEQNRARSLENLQSVGLVTDIDTFSRMLLVACS
ncbi:cysteine hydrolase [Komarekiella sp. 'clone 1']|uniref:Cysteine hydrolase n=1 Tax=Komarekiella delphini-convector SJRDD-AB1 TaxID=2593771 RepID=A0AA40VPL7_9NOST|nr:cysteine hydrolase [Komarekiella delphini-convector]MBD6614895.1 cysteine hydrolase [Komarekiella delphini-convector SJRDD-AB1]